MKYNMSHSPRPRYSHRPYPEKPFILSVYDSRAARESRANGQASRIPSIKPTSITKKLIPTSRGPRPELETSYRTKSSSNHGFEDVRSQHLGMVTTKLLYQESSPPPSSNASIRHYHNPSPNSSPGQKDLSQLNSMRGPWDQAMQSCCCQAHETVLPDLCNKVNVELSDHTSKMKGYGKDDASAAREDRPAVSAQSDSQCSEGAEESDEGHTGSSLHPEGRTVLHIASENGSHEIVRILLKYQTNLEAADHEGCTALQLAALHGHLAVVELLVRANAIVNSRDKHGWTALQKSTDQGHVEVVRFLLDRGAILD